MAWAKQSTMRVLSHITVPLQGGTSPLWLRMPVSSETTLLAARRGQEMTKAEIVARVATQTQLPTQQAATIVEGVVQCILDALRTGDTVEPREFGSFRCRHWRPRTGHHPKTGVAVQVSAKMLPCFKASQAMHARLSALEPLPSQR